MSHFSSVDVQYKSKEALVTALLACGFTRDQIEVHDEAAPMKDYHGSTTKYIYRDTQDERFKDGDKAHVIVRAKHIGRSSNDMGWYIDNKSPGREIICDFDRGQKRHFRNPELRQKGVKKWSERLKQEYAVAQASRTFVRQGKKVHRVDAPNGKVHLFARA